MIEQDSGAGKQIVCFTIVCSCPVGSGLGYSVGAAGITTRAIGVTTFINLITILTTLINEIKVYLE